MIAPVPDRTIACPGVSWSARKGGMGNTTGGWQDKGPRGAAVGGRVASIVYAAISRGAGFSRTSRPHCFTSIFTGLMRCAVLQP